MTNSLQKAFPNHPLQTNSVIAEIERNGIHEWFASIHTRCPFRQIGLDTDLEPKRCELHMVSIAADGGFYRIGYSRAINFNCRQFYSRGKKDFKYGSNKS